MKIPSYLLGLAALVCTACIPVSAAEDCVALPPGLVGWWSGDGNAQDLSGNYNFGSPTGIAYSPGLVSEAFWFDGDAAKVKIGQSANLNVQSLTLAAWINPADETYRPILTYQQQGDYMGAFIWAGKPPGGAAGTLYSNLRQSPWDNNEIFVSGVIPTNQWSLVAVTYDQTSGVNRLYVNGTVVKEKNIGFLIQRTAAPLYIGHLPETLDALPPTSFYGLIDEPQVYNRALSTNELNAIYLAGSAGVCKPQLDAPISLQQATATFSQTNGDFAVRYAIDGDNADGRGWGIDPQIGPQTAVFESVSDFGFPGGTKLTFRLVFNHISVPGTVGGTLGRFRLSVTTDSREMFADGLSNGGDVSANWTPLPIKSAISEAGAVVTVLEDHSLLVSGTLSEVDTYVIEAGTRLSGITGIRLEALQDPSLPMNGPGREENGNFVVSELIVTARPGLAPVIDQAPTSITVTVGSSTNFTVSASSSLPLTYQWFFNGQTLDGETNATLSLESVSFENAGTYTVEVTNPEEQTLSSGAVLNVVAEDPSTAATLRISNEAPTNAPISDIEGELLAGPQFLAQAYVGSTSETLVRTGPAVPFLNADDAGFFVPIDLVLTNVAQGSNVFVQVRVWETAGGSSHEAAIQNGAQYGASETIETSTGGGTFPTPDLEGLSAFSLVAAPRILTQPESTLAYVGQSPAFEVVSWGSGPLTFTWFYNSNALAGANSASLTVTNVQLNQAGDYYVVVGNSVGAVTSSVVALTVEMPDVTPPVITLTSPTAGSTYDLTVTLSGSVTDSKPITAVTWSRNGTASGSINLSTNGEFSIENISLSRGVNTFVVSATDDSTNTSSVEVIVTNVPSRTLAVGTIPFHQEGSQVRVPIVLTSRGEVGGGSFDLTVNRSHLVEPEIEWNVPGGSLTSFNTNSFIQGRVRASFALSGTTLPTGAVQIATITFRSMSVQGTTPSARTLSSGSFFGADGRELAIAGTELKSGSVVLTRREFIGDNNGNDRLDINDATIVMRFVSFLEQRRPWDVFLNDLNKNFQLDVGDVTLVLRAVVGLDPQPTNPPAQPVMAASLRASSTASGRISMTADKQKALPGEKVKVTLSLKDFSGPVSGLSFRIQYPAAALRLENSTAHRTGALVPGDAMAIWNVAPSQNDYAAQNGTVMVAMTSARSWSTNSGDIAELIFTVQEAADDQYRWLITVSQAEVSSGFELVGVAGAELFYFGRDAAASQFDAGLTFSEEGLTLGIRTETGLAYRIEVSEDLVTWELLTTLEGTGGSASVTDADAEKTGQRFYRAIQVP